MFNCSDDSDSQEIDETMDEAATWLSISTEVSVQRLDNYIEIKRKYIWFHKFVLLHDSLVTATSYTCTSLTENMCVQPDHSDIN